MLRCAAIVAAAAFACAATARAPQEAPQAGPPADFAAAMARYDRMPDPRGTGPYPAEKTVDPAFPDHVVYRPIDLTPFAARPLPMLVWGNGGCSSDGASSRLFLAEIASHGYLVVAPGAVESGPGIVRKPPPAQPQLGVETTTAEVRAGIDMAAKADHESGPWHDKLDLSRVAVAGWSCGGLQALQIASDPRIKAVVILHSGVFNDGQNPIKGLNVSKALLKTLRTPILYILGGPSDIAYANGRDDVARIDTVPVFLADHNAGHGGTLNDPNGGSEAQVTVNWLDWQLKGDAKAGAMFTGEDCGLCTDHAWTVVRKDIK
jgi:dienelactone hydrolase